MKAFITRHGRYILVLIAVFGVVTLVLLWLSRGGDGAFDYLIY